MQELFDYLSSMGLAEDRLEQTLATWDVRRLTSFLDRYREIFPPFTAQDVPPAFSLIANTGLSGGPFPCISPDCRIAQVDKLGRFAALYADRVLIRDPLEELYHWGEHQHSVIDVALGLRILYHLRPLLEYGLVGLASGTLSVCPSCYRRLLAESGIAPESFARARAALSKRFAREVTAVLEREAHGIFVSVRGPTTLLEHGQAGYLVVEGPTSPRYLASIKTGARLSPAQLQKTGAVSGYVGPIVDDIALQNLYAHRFGFAYLTDRSVDLDLLKAVNSVDDNRINRALLEGLTHTLPVVNGVSLKEILKIRATEGEAFLVYRDAVRSVLDNLKDPSPARVREAFLDVVQPEVHRIDKAIADSRKLAGASAIRQLLGAGVLGVAYFAGFLPSNINDLVAAIGGVKVVDGVVQTAARTFQEPSAAVENKYYFLWKVKERAQSRASKR